MEAAKETALGTALRAHRESHQGCHGSPGACPEYLDIAKRATESRKVHEGPRLAYSWLSVREAQTA